MTVPWRVLPPGVPSLTALPTHRSAAMTVPVRVLPSGVPSLPALTRGLGIVLPSGVPSLPSLPALPTRRGRS